jgi:hypothetical protein
MDPPSSESMYYYNYIQRRMATARVVTTLKRKMKN